MLDRLGDHFSFLSLLESFSLGWFICFAIFGLAYYTNPSEKSFISFLDQFPISSQRSLPKDDHPSNRGHHTITRSRSKTQQQSPKSNSAHRHLKNPNTPISASPQGSFTPLSTPPYNRHNLLLCTLISVNRTQHLALHISFDHPEDDSYPQLEWFLGCFNTWFALRRQIPPVIASLPIFPIHQSLKKIWIQWTWPIPDLLPPQKLPIDSSLQELSPLIKPKRKKSHRTPKSHSLQCQSSDLCDHSTECSTPERSFTPPASGRESDGYSPRLPSPNHESGQLVTNPNLSASLPPQKNGSQASYLGRVTPSSPKQVSLISVTNQVSESIDTPSGVACDSLARSDLPSDDGSVNRSPRSPSSCDPCLAQHRPDVVEPKSPTPSDQPQLHKNHQPSSPDDLEKTSKESKVKVPREDLDKTQHQSSPKRLNEAKDLKGMKQTNLDEKHDQSKSPQANVTKQSAKPKAEVWVSHRKCASINAKSKKDVQQAKKEEESTKVLTRPKKVEVVKLPKARDIKIIKKNESKEKLAIRQAEPNKTREVNLKQSKPNNNPAVTRTLDRHSPIPDPEARQATLVPHHSFGSSTPPPQPDHVSNFPMNTLVPMTSIPPISQAMMPSHLENFNTSLLLHDVPPRCPLSDPWAPDPWSETVHQSHIRDSFISLPNLERSALKDHYPILRGLDHASPLHSFSPSPLADELFHYQQEPNLSQHMTNSPEWPCPPPIQTSSYGAIGQQGSGIPAQVHSSPVLSASLFRFPGPSAHSPHFTENAILARPNSARKENISRTSSSNSLSQLPEFCSNRSSPSQSPYTPIGTSLHPRHSPLNEVCERPGEALSGVSMAYPLNGATGDPFEGHAQESNMTQHSLRPNGISQGLLSFDPTVSSPVRNLVDGFFPIKGMRKMTSGMSGHHSTQSLNGIPLPTLNSIFDVGPEKDFPTLNCSPTPKRSGQSLNPSAKVFAFGGGSSKATSVQSSCPPVSSVEKQRARGYSQSTIPTSSPSCLQKPNNSSNLSNKGQGGQDKDKSKNLLKSLHRSSWSVVLDFKGVVSSVEDFKPQSSEISNLQFGESLSRLGNRTSVLSELSRLSSSEEVLPAARSKSACSGLFGSIGDMKSKRTSASSSANVSPSATSSVLGQPFLCSTQITT